MKRILLLAFLLMMAIPIPRTAADTTIGPYTTTADFDAGDKTMGNPFFANNGRDQPMYSHITNPSAIYANGRTYVVWQSSPSWLPYISAYTHSTGTWATPVQVSSSIPAGQDGHGAPAVFVTSNGFIHVMYGSHQSSQEYSRSTAPYDISSWTTMTDPVAVATYPNLWQYGGNLYFLYRRTGLDDWTIRISTNNGDSWGAENVISSFSGGAGNGSYFGGAYAQYQDRIYFSFNHVTGAGVRSDAFVFYVDLDNLNCFSVSGTNLGTQISEAEAIASLRVRDTPFQSGQTVVHLTSDGLPYLMYSSQIASGSNPAVNLNFTRWTGSAWTADQQITTSDTGSNYFDFLIGSASSVEAFITGSGEDWITNGDEYSGDMERWLWNGSTWSFDRYIIRERESGKPVNHPEVPMNYRSDLRLIFDEFGALPAAPHEYVGSLDDLKMYGWGGNDGFAYRHEVSSGNPGVETITDNGRFVAANIATLSRFPDDEFDTADADADTWKWNLKTWDGGGPSPTMTYNQREIIGGAFIVNASVAASPGGETGLVSPFSYSVDFDYWASAEQLYYSFVSGFGSFNLIALNLPLPRCELTGASTADGVYYRFLSPSSGTLQAFTCTNGALAQQGGDTALSDTTFCIRIRKIGYNWTTFYSTSLSCSAWVQDEDFDFNVTGSIYPSTTVAIATATSVTFHMSVYDVFMDVSGSTFRPVGRWTSPLSTLTDHAITTITIEHSSLTTTAFIDRVEIVEDGLVVWSYTADITTGIQTVLIPSKVVDGVIGIRVVLASTTQTSSPVLDSLSFAIATQQLTFLETNIFGWLLFLVLLAVGAGGRAPPLRVFLILAGMILFFLSISTFGSGNPAYLVIGLGAAILFMLIGSLSMLFGEGDVV